MGASSPRAAAAQRLGPLLTRVMAARGVSKRGLSQLIGVRRTTLQWWCAGAALPRLEIAAKLSEALADDRILEIVQEARTGVCPCGAIFEIDPGSRRRYCSRRCRTVEQKVRNGILPQRAAVMRDLELARDAIADFCGRCEPEGLCHDNSCALRPVSPLPLVAIPVVAIAQPARQGPLTADGLRRRQLATRDFWARLTPEERSAHVARIRAARWGVETAS